MCSVRLSVCCLWGGRKDFETFGVLSVFYHRVGYNSVESELLAYVQSRLWRATPYAKCMVFTGVTTNTRQLYEITVLLNCKY